MAEVHPVDQFLVESHRVMIMMVAGRGSTVAGLKRFLVLVLVGVGARAQHMCSVFHFANRQYIICLRLLTM